ncbi:SDR family oxidoreductase [Rhizorhabdus wittichii]|uniref:SDR family oxidoreductase n=1 Tax=Rhizorhabdus wittichii TaxID=160791 RepID=A0A975D1H9_9SPHN|nr:SDR family oxidoreductase [Rhizorhabdus wittichii]QTH21144.1 SDR family oxidoreductase [Rhizorhabdus wittichii]
MSQDRFDLSGRVAIVTGATQGMGAACAECFAASGARLILTSRTASALDAVAADLNARFAGGGTIAAALAGDIGDKAHLRALVDLALERFGAVTTLLCAPTIRPWIGPSIDTPDAVLEEQLTYIFRSRFWLSNMVIPHMVAAGGGSLIYIGSGSVFESTTERSCATIARAAEWQMMKNYAAEFGRSNVRANTIAPGMVASSGSQALFDSPAGARRIAGLPMRRGGRVDEIASVAAFLASDASSFTTGAVIPVDGGRLLHAVDGMLTQAYGAAAGGKGA